MQIFNLFSRCLGALHRLADPPAIEVVIVATLSNSVIHLIILVQSPLTGSFNCKTVLIIKMFNLILSCLKCTFGKFKKSVIYGKNTIFLQKKNSLKTLPFKLQVWNRKPLWLECVFKNGFQFHTHSAKENILNENKYGLNCVFTQLTDF